MLHGTSTPKRHLVACAAGLVLLTGCSQVDAGVIDGPGPAASNGGALGAWMDDVCTAVGSVASVADQRREADWADLADSGTAAELVFHLELVSSEVGDARAALEAAGEPPVEDGSSAFAELQEGFQERQDAVHDAAEFIEGATARRGPLVAVQMASAAHAAYTAAPRLARLLERRSELRDAYDDEPACGGL